MSEGFEWFDTNLDGVGDQGFGDTDGNGLYDTVVFDTNFDGYVDASGQDVDANGVLDVVQSDTNGDGVFDTVAWDTDQNGVLDQAAGPASGGLVVSLGQPDDVSTAVMDATVVGPAAYSGPESLSLDPRAMADPVTWETVQRIADSQAEQGFVWTLPDGFVRERTDEW